MRNKVLFLFLGFSLSISAQKKPITLNDIWASGAFYPKSVSGFIPLANSAEYCIEESDVQNNSEINVYSYETGAKTKTILNFGEVLGQKDNAQIVDFQLNTNNNIVLVYYDTKSIYRHSSEGKFVVVDVVNNRKLANNPKLVVRYPTLNPQGDKVAYVLNNDLYILDLLTTKTKRITKDGVMNQIINGAVDWVYEEEFSMSKGFEWNSDGTKLAFYKFNETRVKLWNLAEYGEIYTNYQQYKYPKAGEQNSVVDIYIADAIKGKSTKLNLGSEQDQYLPRFHWTKNPNDLMVQRLNRLQNKLELLLVQGQKITPALTETNNAYVEIKEDIFFTKDGKHMIIKSEADGFTHLYFNKVEGPQIYQITKGKFDVDQLIGVDEKNELVYFSSSEVSPTQRHIYKVGFDGQNKTQLTTEAGWHTATFNTDFSIALHSYSSLANGVKYVLRKSNWETLRVLENNEAFENRLSSFELSTPTFGEINVNGENLNYWMIKPNNFNESTEYPLLMFVYGGPGSQTVKNSFGYGNYFWHQMLANTLNIIVVSVDNRGTGFRGEKFKKMTYRQLGKYETEDQIAAAKYFGNETYIDKNRIGIWGWSYGGYMSSLCLTKGSDVFKTAIAVAPVTNWRYYDNIYTERYMGLPQDNALGYDTNSPINHVDKMKGKYLLVHGTADDNVHFENSILMADALIKINKPFESAYYPNKNHGIYGGKTRLHLYTLMTKFLEENL